MTIQALHDPALLREACLIGGQWRAAGSGRTLDVIDPATQEAIGAVPDADGADTRAAVEAAAAAFGGGLMVLADWAGRALAHPYQIPAGLVSALIGAPFLMLMLRRKA